jgi:hypothetical protein
MANNTVSATPSRISRSRIRVEAAAVEAAVEGHIQPYNPRHTSTDSPLLPPLCSFLLPQVTDGPLCINAPEEILKVGYLTKKAAVKSTKKSKFALHKRQKKRFFELASRHLSYYNTEGGDLKGVIELCNNSTVEVDCKPGGDASVDFCMQVKTLEKEVYIIARDTEEMSEWAEAVKEAIGKIPKATGEKMKAVNKTHTYSGGTLVMKMQGAMRGFDEDSGQEYTEYILMCNFRMASGGGDTWSVAARWQELKDLHAKLDTLKAHVKNLPSFPGTVVAKSKDQRVELRVQKLQEYLDGATAAVAAAEGVKVVDFETFFELDSRVPKVKRAGAMIEGQNTESKKLVDDDAEDELQILPMNEMEVQQAGGLVRQLWRVVQGNAATESDIRYDPNIQKLLCSALSILPQLRESARVGPYTVMSLLPYAQQYLSDLENTLHFYNDVALTYLVTELRVDRGLDKDDWKEQYRR